MKKLLFIILIYSIFISCSHYIINESGYTRPPEKFKFSYKKKSAILHDNNIIDTTAIYYVGNINYYKDTDEYKAGNEYIRFYADGRFKIQGTKVYPNINDVNNINEGIVGYYKLNGNIVKLKVYSDINAGSEQKIIGMINEDKNLILLNTQFSSTILTQFTLGYVNIWNERTINKEMEKSNFSPKIYKKIYLEGITYEQPNW